MNTSPRITRLAPQNCADPGRPGNDDVVGQRDPLHAQALAAQADSRPGGGIKGDEAATIVSAWWTCIQARNWAGARALLVHDAAMHWPVTDERFVDADTIVRVNAVYPAGWSLRIVEIDALVDGRVHSLVEVEQDGRCFFAHSRFSLNDQGRITSIVEHWADQAPPPAWRTVERLGPAYQRGPSVVPATSGPAV